MTARLVEIHVRRAENRWGWLGGWWRVEMTPAGGGKVEHLATLYTQRRAASYARRKQWELRAVLGASSELYVHAENGRILDRSTYPRGADPEGRG